MGPPDAVIAIDNLLVDGALVDVTFSNTGFSTTFPTNDPFYNGNSQGAEDAANAIALTLTSAGATDLLAITASTGETVSLCHSALAT